MRFGTPSHAKPSKTVNQLKRYSSKTHHFQGAHGSKRALTDTQGEGWMTYLAPTPPAEPSGWASNLAKCCFPSRPVASERLRLARLRQSGCFHSHPNASEPLLPIASRWHMCFDSRTVASEQLCHDEMCFSADCVNTIV